MCCNAPVSDVVIEAIEASNARDIPQQQITTKVKNIEFKGDVALLHLRTPRTKRLRFLAGQYAALSGGPGLPVSNYSISSCPCDDMNLQFQIPRIAGEAFSEHVFENLKAGDVVDINGPHGEFVLDETSVRSLVFVAWHTGFAPIKSLIEHAMALDDAEHIHLFWIAASPKDRYLDNLCRAWQDALDNFHYHTIDADLFNDDPGAHQQALDSICHQLDTPADYDYYIAGRNALITACSNMTQQYAVPSTQLMGDTIKHE
jgi:CDP-4-dehydro-6-deoxyglucose reductase